MADRIKTEFGRVSLSDIKLNEKNWRKHDRDQRKMFKEAIAETGFITPVIFNKRTGNILDGHLRVSEAKASGDLDIDAIIIDIDQAHEDKILALLDKVGGMAKADKDKYKSLLESIKFDSDYLAEKLNEKKKILDEMVAAEYELMPEMLLNYNYILLVFKDEVNFNAAKDEFGIDKKIDRYNGSIGTSMVADGDAYICRKKA